jgi:uncharacterized protein YeaO (DUF488 family)
VYGQAAADDGIRVLVDRIWPRGMRKDGAGLQRGPSTSLRPLSWPSGTATTRRSTPSSGPVYRDRYRDELDTPSGRAALDHLRTLLDGNSLTLLTAANDVEHSQAAV